MSLKQFNIAYSPQEDRIIFRFNTIDNSEYKFWLTRRVTHFTLMFANQFIEKEYKKSTPSVDDVMLEIEQSGKQESSFSKAYEPGVNHPLGPDPILVIDAKCEMMKIDGQEIFSLDYVLSEGRIVNLKLPVPIMQKLFLLLEEQNIQAHWGSY